MSSLLVPFLRCSWLLPVETPVAESIGLVFVLALATASSLTPLVRRLARTAGAIDMPDARRIHLSPTPRWGGLAVFGAELASLIITAVALETARAQLVAWGWLAVATGAGTTLLLVLGLADDRKPVSPSVKLAAEIAAAGFIVLSGCRVRTVLGIDLGILSIPVTVGWIVAVVNAFNMIDGLDGLASGLALMISLTLMVPSVEASDVGAALMLAALGGAALGFLCYNLNPASIFLGDSGSLPIGFVMAVMSTRVSGKGPTAATVLFPLLALGLPLVELLVTTLRRLLRAVNVVRSARANGEYQFRVAGKAALFTADRDHIHHRLLALGLSQRKTTFLMYGASVVVNASALALLWDHGPYGGILPLAAAVVLIVCVRLLGYRELQLVRNGLLLPLFPARLLELRSLQVPADLAFSVLSLVAAYAIHMPSGQNWADLPQLTKVAVAQIVLLALGGLYGRSHSFASTQGALVIARSIFYSAFGTAFLSWVMVGSPLHSSEILIIDVYLFATLIIGYRVSYYLLDHIFNNANRTNRRVLIYGIGEPATSALHTILGSPSLRMTVVGFIEEGPAANHNSYLGLPVFGSDAFNMTPRDFDEIILPGTISDKTVRKLGMRCKLAKLPLKRLSVDCAEINADGEQRDLIDASDVLPGAS